MHDNTGYKIIIPEKRDSGDADFLMGLRFVSAMASNAKLLNLI